MKFKLIFEKALVRYGSLQMFRKYIRRFTLEECIVESLIHGSDKRRIKKLAEYVRYHRLNPTQISAVLSGEKSIAMLETVRHCNLNEQQQLELVKKNNAWLLEAYLCPQGYLLPERRFVPAAEYVFITAMIRNENYVGVEIFKAYVDNTARDLVSTEVLEQIVKNDSWASRYILCRAGIKHEQEEFFVMNASEAMLTEYVNMRQLWSEAAQIYLLEHQYDVAERHFRNYGLRSGAQDVYHAMRRKAAEEKKKLQAENSSSYTS